MSSTTPQDRLAALAARVKAGSKSIPPVDEFGVKYWFQTISESVKGRERLQEAVDYYRRAIADGRQHMTACGNLEALLAETPGLEHFYKGILVDCQQVRRWLEEVHEFESARKYKWFMSAEAQRQYGELKTTEITKLVKAEDNIATLAFAIRTVANVENHLMSLIEGFATRNINLGRIQQIRQANLQDVWVDPTGATRNV